VTLLLRPYHTTLAPSMLLVPFELFLHAPCLRICCAGLVGPPIAYTSCLEGYVPHALVGLRVENLLSAKSLCRLHPAFC